MKRCTLLKIIDVRDWKYLLHQAPKRGSAKPASEKGTAQRQFPAPEVYPSEKSVMILGFERERAADRGSTKTNPLVQRKRLVPLQAIRCYALRV